MMHILVIGKPRCRTSYLTSAMVNKFNISNNYYENYNYNFNFEGYIEKLKLTKSNPDIEHIVKKQSNHLETITEKLFSENNGIIKLFPRHIISHLGDKRKIYSFKDFNYKIISNISKTLRLDKFNTILLLDRELPNAAISYIVGKITGQALFTEQEKVLVNNIASSPITITEAFIPQLNYFILEYIVYQDLYNFMKNNYNCKTLHYDNVVSYVTKELNINDNYYIDPKFDYSKIVTNYDDIVMHCNLKYEEYSNLYIKNNFI